MVTTVPEDHAHLKGIVTVYAYATRDLRRPPQKVDELLPIFEKARIEDPQSFLTSTRDGQPYVMIYGKRPPNVHRDLVGYEQTGVDGKRYVAFTLGNVEEVDETRFRELVKDAA